MSMPIKYVLSAFVVVACIAAVFIYVQNQPSNNNTNNNSQTSSENKSERTDEFNKQAHSISEPTSLWVVVNKQNQLPIDYVPNDLIVPDVRLRLSAGEQQMQLSKRAENDLMRMFKTAEADGVSLVFGSGYRSATLQKQFYDSYVASDGQTQADTYSARPGHSEHQTGLGVDITSPGGNCHLQICWEDTAEGKWVAQNAQKFGFIIRYQKGKESLTGYQYEPWHLRYVGKNLARELHASNQTMEEFFGLGSAANYN